MTRMPRIHDDDAGMAMTSVLIAILLTAGLSILVLGMVLSQLLPTQFLRASSQTVFAAEAGTQAVIAQIRTADGAPDATGAVYGDRTKLPCSAQGPVDGATAGLSYQATVAYFTQDPKGRPESWLLANAIPCTPGSGPQGDPNYAVITAEGIGAPVAGMPAGAGDRTVSVVYEFTVTNVNIPGGLIYSYDASISPDRYCLQADSATAGSLISYVLAAQCGTDDVLQLWTYDTDYTLKLASTTTPGSGTPPLCITGPVTSGQREQARLAECVAAPSAGRWNQLWSWEGGANFRGQNPENSNYSTITLYSGEQSGTPAGRKLWVGPVDANNREWGSFNPDPRVGAGAAGYATRQVVSYLEFGRCFDVTTQTVTYHYMIVFPCKQDPSPGGANVFWNHKWYYTEPATGTAASGPQNIWVYNGNGSTEDWCLVSPNTEGGFVTLTSECNPSALNQQWIRYGDTGSYENSYTFVDAWGRCITVDSTTRYLNAFSTMITKTCDFSLAQKWNAPPGVIAASLEGYRELP